LMDSIQFFSGTLPAQTNTVDQVVRDASFAEVIWVRA